MTWRPLPELTDSNRFFWTSGADGRLRFLHCAACDYHIHPPAPVCPGCLSADVAPRAVSGKATVRSVTINHQPWGPVPAVPYAIAIVNLDEQDDLNLTTNIVGVEPDSVAIGAAVRVVFERHDNIYIPLFELDGR